MHPPPRPSEPEAQATLPELVVAADGWDTDRLSVELPRDQERRWRHGERVLVEDYLQLFPALAHEPRVVLGLIRQEFVLREALADAPDLEEYLGRFPQYRQELEALLSFRAVSLPRRLPSGAIPSSPRSAGAGSGPCTSERTPRWDGRSPSRCPSPGG